RYQAGEKRRVRVREVQVEEQHLSRIPPGEGADEVERDGRAPRTPLRRVHADDRRLLQEHAPGGLDGRIGKRALALVGELAQLFEGVALAAGHRAVQALPVEREQVAIGLRVDRRLLRPVQETGSLAKEVA